MKNPTTIEEIINWPKEYRVIADGRELECRSIFFDEETVSLWNHDDKDFSALYTIQEVQELTPLSSKGKRIAIGDWVNSGASWLKVYGYRWMGNYFYLLCAKEEDINDTWSISEDSIQGHKTTSPDNEVEKAIKLLTDKGIIIDGKVIL